MTVCDFCSTNTGPFHAYPVEDHVSVIAAPGHAPVLVDVAGPWTACPTCTAYIEADDAKGLAQHSAASFRTLAPSMLRETNPAALSRLVYEQQQSFWTHRRS